MELAAFAGTFAVRHDVPAVCLGDLLHDVETETKAAIADGTTPSAASVATSSNTAPSPPPPASVSPGTEILSRCSDFDTSPASNSFHAGPAEDAGKCNCKGLLKLRLASAVPTALVCSPRAPRENF